MKKNILYSVGLICSILLCILSCSIEKIPYLSYENFTKSRSIAALKSGELRKKRTSRGLSTMFVNLVSDESYDGFRASQKRLSFHLITLFSIPNL